MKIAIRLCAVGALLVVLLGAPQANGESFSLDFDGTGTGASFSVDFVRPSSDGPSFYHSRSTGSSSIQSFLQQRYRDQVRQAQERAEAHRLQVEIERKRALGDIQAIQADLDVLQRLERDEPNTNQRMADIQQVLDLEKQVARAGNEYGAALPSYRERLMYAVDHANVPLPSQPPHYHRILILGMWATQKDVKRYSGKKDPFTGKVWNKVFAFGSKDSESEPVRVALDHILSTFDRLSPATSAQLAKLKDASADEVVCHSNGCIIAEVLIASGQLKAKRLQMLGGDTSFYQLTYLKELAERVGLQEISVNVIAGDPVPILDEGWKIADLMRKIDHPLESFRKRRNNPLYQFLGLVDRPRFNPDDRVQIHELTYPGKGDGSLFFRHHFSTYQRVIRGWRMSGCLASGGRVNQRCIVY